MLQAELARISAIKVHGDLAKEIARLHGFGADALFSTGADQRLEDATQVIAYLDQSGLNLPEPGYYFGHIYFWSVHFQAGRPRILSSGCHRGAE